MLLKACLNGPRTRAEHPALPVTPAQLATAAAEAVAAGAGAVHLHVKDDDARDTFDGARLAAVLAAVRVAAPGTPVGVTTGAWAQPDPARRVAAIEAWPVLPDFASVNWHVPGAERVAAALLGRGVDVEAGLWDVPAVAAWWASPVRDRCLRVLLELPAGLDPDATRRWAGVLLDAVTGRGEPTAPLLLHGLDSSAWPALAYARDLGLATRIGLEDVLTLPDGSPAPDNAALVRAARELPAT